MWIIIPLAPVVIAILCIALGLFGEIQRNLQTINTILIVVVAIVFIGIAIYNATRRISTVSKVCSTIACAAGGVVSSLVLNYFISALASIEFGILGLFEFVLVLVMGGCIALLIVLGCIYACCWFSGEW